MVFYYRMHYGRQDTSSNDDIGIRKGDRQTDLPEGRPQGAGDGGGVQDGAEAEVQAREERAALVGNGKLSRKKLELPVDEDGDKRELVASFDFRARFDYYAVAGTEVGTHVVDMIMTYLEHNMDNVFNTGSRRITISEIEFLGRQDEPKQSG